DVEHANMASAFDHAILGDGAKALRMCVALTVWWKLRGRFAMADAAYRRALAAAPDDAERLRARTLWAHGYLLTYGGLYEEAVAIEGEALALARTLGDDSTAARALDVLGTLQSFPDPAGAREPLEQARELARASGDEWCFVDATQIVGYTMLMQGDTGAEAMLDEALETIERTGYPEFAAWHWGGIAWARTIAGRYEEALELLERAIAVADSVGEPVSSGVAHGSRGQVRAERGEGAAVLREVGAVLERSVAAGAGMALPSLSIAGQIARASIGELEEARPGLREWAASEMAYARALASCVLARVALGLGEAGDAAEEAQRAREVATGPLENHMLAAEATVLLARATLMDGDRAAADALAHGALDAALEGGYAGVVPPTLDVLAGAAAAEESFEEAARILAAGERAWQRLGRARWVCEQAEIEALTERIRDALGEETFGEAFREAGALSLEDALAWMRRARGTRKRPAGGWESLTPTEKQVVALVAEGLTNPEVGERMFIARGTVKMHLSHIYAKLEIRNRSELAALAARRGTQNASETVSEIAGSAATRE
ncbi:MAG TPA: LuxR C-terminal-related transcriptional regulator, partial [Solirubrobacteraceae bacterium]|nr:LuxR C-terminal-related transcriptional regulator [Solirubrobacteraceae bacterium]